MSVFAYNHADADTSSDEIRSVVSGLESNLLEMDGEVRKLSSAWEGREQEQYRYLYNKWASAAENLRFILEQIQAALNENTSNVIEMRNRASGALSGR